MSRGKIRSTMTHRDFHESVTRNHPVDPVQNESLCAYSSMQSRGMAIYATFMKNNISVARARNGQRDDQDRRCLRCTFSVSLFEIAFYRVHKNILLLNVCINFRSFLIYSLTLILQPSDGKSATQRLSKTTEPKKS